MPETDKEDNSMSTESANEELQAEEHELHEKHKIEEKKLHEKHAQEAKKLHEKHHASHSHKAHHEGHHHESAHSSVGISAGKKSLFLALAIIVVLALIVFGAIHASKQSVTPNTNKNTGDYGVANMEFYVMSQCPYGKQVEDGIAPVVKKLGKSLNLTINYIGNANGNTFTSLHGNNEVLGNKVQLCANKYSPDKSFDLIECMNKAPSSIPTNWESCAKDVGIVDASKIKTCYEGTEANDLLRASFDLSSAKGASGSPTMFLNGQPYNGGRDDVSFLRAICNQIPTHPECAAIPVCGTDADCKQTGKVGTCVKPGEKDASCTYTDPQKVPMTLLTDKRCGTDCDISNIIPQLQQLFPGVEITTVDYSSDEGKKLYSSTGVAVLPALLFTDVVKSEKAYAQIAQYFEQKGTYLNLRIGASFNPTKEICDNKIDDTANGKIDCDDDDCKEDMLCRKEVEKNVQLFIMADCPYGKEAVKGLKGVIDNFGKSVTYDIHYIANEDATGKFTSLHGDYEAAEDIVQLCAKKYSADKWFDYVLCRSTKGIKGADWKACATESGIDIAKVETCSTGDEGKKLMSDDIKVAQSLGISASPTWLANNKYTFNGLDANTAKTNICQHNAGLDNCDVQLASTTATPAGNCG